MFAAYTDPELIPEWWGPRGTTTIVDEMDVRPGAGLIAIDPPAGPDFKPTRGSIMRSPA
jgi:uncharacterized protein YndB with AHSA1/START domain